MSCTGCVSCIFDNPNIPNDAHEIHVTVEDVDVDQFKTACVELGIKSVLIAMQNEKGGTFHHLMTSRTFRGDCLKAARRALEDRIWFENKGWKVARLKIETTLNNPEIDDLPGGYFESHIEIIIPKEELISVKGKLASIDHRLRISNNAFKVHDHKVSYFVTMRVVHPDCTPELFHYEVADTVERLEHYFEIGKIRSEYAWYDSNFALDKDWK